MYIKTLRAHTEGKPKTDNCGDEWTGRKMNFPKDLGKSSRFLRLLNSFTRDFAWFAKTEKSRSKGFLMVYL